MESLGILRVDGELSVLMQLPVKLDVFVEIQEAKKKSAFSVSPPYVCSATHSCCLRHPGPWHPVSVTVTLPPLSVFSFCHCQQLKVLCLLSLSVKVRCIVSELQKGGLEAAVKDAVVFLLPRLMKVDAAVSPYQKKKKRSGSR